MITRDSAPDKHYIYKPGAIIKVEFRPEPTGDDTQDGQSHHDPPPSKPDILFFKVLDTLSRTLSCVLLVDLIPGISMSEGARHLVSTSPHILKLCERRFSDAHRKEYDAEPWTPSIEAEYKVFRTIPENDRPHISVAKGDNSWEYDPGHAHDQDPALNNGTEDPADGKKQRKKIHPDEWSIGHREAYLELHCEKLYKQEVDVYRGLGEVQGDLVPRLYGTVVVPRKDRKGRRRVQSRGMLIEYMRDSFSLREVPERVPDQGLWQEIGSDAVRLVQQVGDVGVINKDVRLDNILVMPMSNATTTAAGDADMTPPQYRLVMIDFGLARLQADDESDDEFRKARIQQDEEGAVGYVLSKHLLKHAQQSETFNGEAPFYYRPSGRLIRSWDADDDDI